MGIWLCLQLYALASDIFGSDVTEAMWVPANKDALPSTEEMRCAKGAIKELETMLEQAKAQVVALTKDLEERQAWIAPIRKVPFEILSEIFIFTSEMDDLSPVTITGVCRLWRKLVLSTPRAWSLVYADRLNEFNSVSWGQYAKLPSRYFSTFIECSNPCMLHIRMPYSQFDEETEIHLPHSAEKVLLSAGHRIECLSITSWQLVGFKQDVFPNLTKLTLLDGDYDIGPFFFSRSRFSCLRYLDCTNCPMDNSLQPGTILFPQLQHLAVDIEVEGSIELVQGCADSLVGLKVLQGGATLVPRVTISFPKLNSLDFRTISDVTMLIQAITPALQSYEQTSHEEMQPRVFHDDIKKVAHLRTNRLLDLAGFVSLRVLQFELKGHESPFQTIRTILHRLEENKDTCPILQRIQFSLSKEDYGDADFKAMIPSFDNILRGPRSHITLSFMDEPLAALPGSFEEAECGPDMPCMRHEPL